MKPGGWGPRTEESGSCLLEDILSNFGEEALGSKTAPIKDKQRETWEKKTQETLGREGGRGERDYGIQARLSLPWQTEGQRDRS